MDIKDILLWHDVKVSAIVFVSGFVLLVCLTQFSVVSVFTNIALVCLAPMLALRVLLTARSAFLRSEFEHPLKYVLCSWYIHLNKLTALFLSQHYSYLALISLQFFKYSPVLWPLFNCMIEFRNFNRASTKICSPD